MALRYVSMVPSCQSRTRPYHCCPFALTMCCKAHHQVQPDPIFLRHVCSFHTRNSARHPRSPHTSTNATPATPRSTFTLLSLRPTSPLPASPNYPNPPDSPQPPPPYPC